jgi:hypothetical protein
MPHCCQHENKFPHNCNLHLLCIPSFENGQRAAMDKVVVLNFASLKTRNGSATQIKENLIILIYVQNWEQQPPASSSVSSSLFGGHFSFKIYPYIHPQLLL